MQDLIYCFQGVEGKLLRKETDGFGYVLDPKTSKGISLRHRGLVERLVAVGFFHNQLKYFCDSTDKEEGTIAQALSATLREELSDHYRTVAVLQSQVMRFICFGRRYLLCIVFFSISNIFRSFTSKVI